MFRRGEVFWCQDNETRKQESLGTKDREIAERILNAKNEAHHQPIINLQIARAYLQVGDPAVATRTWRLVMEEVTKLKRGDTQARYNAAMRDRAFDTIRDRPVLETRPDHFLRVLEAGTVSTNVFLRRIHNFALDMNWLPWPVLPKRRWPVPSFREKRAITQEEHETIMAREPNPEWKAYFALLWHVGGAQTDVALLRAEDVDWRARIIAYRRKKTGTPCFLSFGKQAEELLRQLPSTGALFPRISQLHEKHRAKHFRRRCLGLGISGISLHSYRYSWAERAKSAGMPERFAMENLGHNSEAVHRSYARKAKVIIPALEAYENGNAAQKVIALPKMSGQRRRSQNARRERVTVAEATGSL
jgi:integrase